MLTSNSEKVSRKIFDAKQWNECMLNLLANEDVEICLRGWDDRILKELIAAIDQSQVCNLTWTTR